MTASEGRILVIEDEYQVAAAIQRSLVNSGYQAVVAPTGEQGLVEFACGTFDLCVLDLALPGADGLKMLAAIRRSSTPVKVIILSAHDSAEDRILGLESGADDYIVKPFSIAELLARIRILLRRPNSNSPGTLTLADLRMDCASRQVVRGERQIDLTPREYVILECLLRNRGAVVTRNMLVREVWQDAQRMTPINNVIDVHIAHLRRKLNGPGEMPLLHTVRGVGFLLGESSGHGSCE
jgi:DNA-binding response OmpR family regulator